MKHILNDKRILRFGVSGNDYQDYLMAEQFVIDVRGYNQQEHTDIKATFDDLQELKLAKLPYSKIVLHVIIPIKTGDEVFSFFIHQSDEKMLRFIFLSDNEIMSLDKRKALNNPVEKEKHGVQINNFVAKLIVFLATRNIIKKHHDVKKSQRSMNDKSHKRGSGGYTIIRRPEAHEISEGDGTGNKKRPHFRRGHIRRLHPEDKTKWIWVSPCFINVEPEVQRIAYLTQAA